MFKEIDNIWRQNKSHVLIQTKNTSTNNNGVIIESETADSEATIDPTVVSSLDLPLTVAKKSNVNK